MIFLQVIFWTSFALMFHSYVLYPLMVYIFSSGLKQNQDCFEKTEKGLPFVSVLLAAFNEEAVIGEKIRTTFETSYALNRMELTIGSDASTDRTDEIITHSIADFPELKLVAFPTRTGKAGIINELSEKASGEVLLLTDANVFFNNETIFELVKHFKNPEIVLVAGNIRSHEIRKDGISRQESDYQTFENNLKYREGILWGAMMGAFGGCYAIRKSFFSSTPENFIVDDFYITISALEKGGRAITELNALCYEDVSNQRKEEFRRKSRIATGNFQIIKKFWKMIFLSRAAISFAFLSHKILRWIGPFLILGLYLSSLILAVHSFFYLICLLIQSLLICIPLLDFILGKLNIHLHGLRYISHFYMMNLALLNGFLKFTTGVKNNVWQPTQRNQF